MRNLKIYDPDPEKSFTKAKVARLKQEHTDRNVSVDIENVATNHIDKFPTGDSAFTNDFSLLPKFVPTDTLEHLKNCGKNASRKSEDTFVEFASSKGLRSKRRSKRSPHGITEAKNVIVKDGETPKNALIKKSICKMSDTVLKVNKSHMYFYQVQNNSLS